MMQLEKRKVALAVSLWIVRVSLAVTLLSAVADRGGWWGPVGGRNVSWGDWSHFVQYCAQVNSFLPGSWAVPLAWLATILEAALGTGLLLGSKSPLITYGTAALFGSFALAMTITFGVKAPLNFSVFCDAAAALLLAVFVSPDPTAVIGFRRKGSGSS